MKQYSLLIFLALIFVGCSQPTNKKGATTTEKKAAVQAIPDNTIDKNELVFKKENSRWYYNDTLFSGFAISKYENDSLLQKIGILNGKKENVCIDWYPNGKMKTLKNYHQGRLHGEKRVWNYDAGHTLVGLLNYENGKAQGEQKKWYPTGELYQVLQMNNGREEGVQQAFRKNGDLYANYEAKNGRIFGMKKAALCFGLEDQKIKNED